MAIFIQVTNDVNDRLIRCRSYVAEHYRLRMHDNELIKVLLDNFWQMEKSKCQEEEKKEVDDFGLF